jgi:hypothetical protein
MMTNRKPKASKARNRASRLMQFRHEMDHIDSEFLLLLRLLNSTASGPQTVGVENAYNPPR